MTKLKIEFINSVRCPHLSYRHITGADYWVVEKKFLDFFILSFEEAFVR